MPDLQAGEPRHNLKRHFLEADDRAVYHALPLHVAEALELDPRAAIELLVDGMFDGETVMHWELRCPFCTFRAEEPDWLRRATHDYTCPACGNTYDVHLDAEAQVTFSPHPTLRPLGPEAYDAAYQEALRERFPPTTVHDLMTVQRFRDWARNEPLPTGEYLEVSRMAVWFSDLTGSTALYARNGDPLAYDLVRDHFRLVFQTVNQHEGAVVKTMGDGIMAVFTANVHALEAALAAHRALEALNREKALSGHRRLALKIGIHNGPSIVVNLSERLDYFGTTVNVASRVSDLAAGTETVLTEPVQSDPQVQALVEASGYHLRRFRSDIRGLEQEMTIFCLTKSPSVSSRRRGWRETIAKMLGRR